MALYTGIDMIKKVKDIPHEVMFKVSNYEEYTWDLEFHESQGGYPTMKYILHLLRLDEEEYEDTDDVYYNTVYPMYIKFIQEIEHIVEQCNLHDLCSKYEEKEVLFVSRNYGLANNFGDLFQFPQFYHRKIIDAQELKEKLQTINPCFLEASKVDFSRTYEYIDQYQDDWFFIVHVS